MSPEYRENQKHKRYGPGRLLRLIASAAVLLVCVCLSTSHSYAWTEIPDWLLQQLPAEQQTLINALPEADRPMAYCYLSDTDADAVHAAADDLIRAFNQSSVLIQENRTATEFYAGSN